jgi:exonuclease SbcD
LQIDFGEAGQQKRVNIVDVKPGQKARVESIPLTYIRQLRNIGSHKQGRTLDEIKAVVDDAGDAYLKVFVKVDRPLPGLAEQIRELLPNAIDIVVQRADETIGDALPAIELLSPTELFATYYRGQHGSEPRPELMSLFSRLYDEVTGAPG